MNMKLVFIGLIAIFSMVYADDRRRSIIVSRNGRAPVRIPIRKPSISGAVQVVGPLGGSITGKIKGAVNGIRGFFTRGLGGRVDQSLDVSMPVSGRRAGISSSLEGAIIGGPGGVGAKVGGVVDGRMRTVRGDVISGGFEAGIDAGARFKPLAITRGNALPLGNAVSLGNKEFISVSRCATDVEISSLQCLADFKSDYTHCAYIRSELGYCEKVNVLNECPGIGFQTLQECKDICFRAGF